MLRITDRLARNLGLRVINVKLTAGQEFRNYADRRPDFKLMGQLRKAMRQYTPSGNFKISKFVRVPYPSYEEKYGGPYSHILTVRYRGVDGHDWGCTFGLTVSGKLVLWMD